MTGRFTGLIVGLKCRRTLVNNFIMELKEYQERSSKTIQDYPTGGQVNDVIPFLGIVGEAGSVLSELKKKLRDGDAYTGFKGKLKEELGDVLWYVSAIATQHGISLDEVAEDNLDKINDRFLDEGNQYRNYDSGYPEKERFPDEFQIEFIPFIEEGRNKVKIINHETGDLIGNTLTDNTHEEDGYRFHDIFHYGYVAYLGWSPVIRKLLTRKRKSKPEIDENEDGARAQIIEEAIALYVHDHAKNHDLLKYSKSIDTDILKTVKQLVKPIEVRDCSAKQWEEAILNSYKVYNLLIENDGGRVMVSLKNRQLIYIGKN